MPTMDVIIVGGGPAGLATAHSLARIKGPTLQIMVMERSTARAYERYHGMCGEGISKKGVEALGLGEDVPIKNEIRKVSERWPGDIATEADVNGFIVDRQKLLAMINGRLRNKVELIEDEATRVVADGHRCTVFGRSGRTFHSRFLVGADGAHSVVRRDIFQATPRLLPVEQFLVEERPDPGTLVLYYDERYMGKYRWRFPNGSNVKVGFPVGTDRPPEGFVERQSRSIPVGPLPRLVNGNVCLVGDAAGQVNPFTFGGLANSFIAANMVADAINRNDLSLYQALWEAHPRSDAVFLQAYEIMRTSDNTALAHIMSPLRFGPNPNLIMQGLMTDQRFRVLYRCQILKADVGW